jgi:hypothetical protein
MMLAARPDFEYGVISVDGSALVAGTLIRPGMLAHLPTGLSRVSLSPAGRRPARFFVVGGQPLGERLLMWWNFVARTGEEITRARQDWADGRFGEVHGYPGDPLSAPPLPDIPLKAR